MWIWRLRGPIICHLQAGGPQKPLVWFKGLRTRELTAEIPEWVWGPEGQERQDVQINHQAGSKFSLPPPFSSMQSLRILNDAYPHWGGQPAFLSAPIQMLVSFRNTFTDTTRSNLQPDIWVCCDPVKLTHKINSHMYHLSLYMDHCKNASVSYLHKLYNWSFQAQHEYLLP